MKHIYKCFTLVILVFVTGIFAIADVLAIFSNSAYLHMTFSVIFLFDFIILLAVCVVLSFSRKCIYYEIMDDDKHEDRL